MSYPCACNRDKGLNLIKTFVPPLRKANSNFLHHRCFCSAVFKLFLLFLLSLPLQLFVNGLLDFEELQTYNNKKEKKVLLPILAAPTFTSCGYSYRQRC